MFDITTAQPRTITQDCDDCDTEGTHTLVLARAATFEDFDNIWDDAMEATREHLRGLGWTIADGDKLCPECATRAAEGIPRPPEEEGFGIRYVGLSCDKCSTTVEGDFRADTKSEGVAAIRAHATTLGWAVTPATDLCPACKTEEAP